MVDDANVTTGGSDAEQLDNRPVAASTATSQRSWSTPKSPVTREQLEQIGRTAYEAARAIGGFVVDAARYGARAVAHMWQVLGAVPAAVRLFVGAGVVMLLGVVGALELHNALGLICTVVIIPVCACTLGALGHRWYSGIGAEAMPRADAPPPTPSTTDLERSVHYVDTKLTLALSSLGTEHHQQAVIALFQAKTAVELTLGTEQDAASCGDLLLRADDYALRPRIRAGAESTPTPRESNSLAAS